MEQTWPGNGTRPALWQVPNLIPGKFYEIQLFAGDNRRRQHARTVSFSDAASGGNSTGSLTLGAFPSIYGYFTADATTQDIYIGGSNHAYLGAAVVYLVPEPSRALLLMLGAGILLLRRKR